MVRTRFAPSPTGFLHVGGVRTALFAWLVAKQAKGQFILRIEDTDKTREVAGSEKHIMECLTWLGLSIDEGPDNSLEFGPYRQSQRLDIYKKWAKQLIDMGRAYVDTTTPEDLDKLRELAKAKKQPFLYRNLRPDSPISQPYLEGTPIRFKSEPKPYSWHDEVMGDLSTGPEVIDDFIILKSDGFPTYNFAHVIDDHLMKISHVIRSQEFLPSVPKFLNLYEALEIKRPKLATLPYVMGPDGKKKLSKRDGAKDLLDYQRQGFLPEALVNFLATLGWNDGTEQEIFSLPELIAKFQLNKVQRSGARFDEQRLLWMNGHYIRGLSKKQLSAKAADFWPATAKADQAYKDDVLGLVQDRLKFLAELPELTNFFFEEPKTSAVKSLLNEDQQLKNISQETKQQMLKETVKELSMSSFSLADIKERLNKLLSQLETKPAILFSLVRIAISGAPSSPELFGTLKVLGKQKSLERLNQAILGLV
ncbi:MAG: glutamate--tRNA ligase [Candidatus Saccharimonadales bacterium]